MATKFYKTLKQIKCTGKHVHKMSNWFQICCNEYNETKQLSFDTSKIEIHGIKKNKKYTVFI